ncbi:hypothetical protein [Actinokineospora sp. NBRC 105648]|uniref:hypothetical protein n=1 Tax=Actinokineospora sp. NBRC 105648 TaxID=3032206 RepID=UPI0024A589C0|nr:hypothetical protein [Actinokineospora sp. NBRC 105648]GLZ39299.1 hypothetical protein Acsp05_29230 [Actinokineospora sp. NBRC 105648]
MIATAVLAAVLLAATPAEDDSAPRLSIAVDNTHASAVAGDRLTYTVTVRNLGATDVSGLGVTQSVPAGLHFDTAEPDGRPRSGAVAWTVDLPPAAEAVFHSTMTVVDTPADQLRVATVACARTAGEDGPPLVCASHSAQLPAGAAAAAQARAPEPWMARNRWYVAGGLIVAAGGALVVRRRFSGREEQAEDE